MEIMFYYRLKGEDFLRDMLYSSIESANSGISYTRSTPYIEESCLILIDAGYRRLKKYQTDEAMAARAARKADKDECAKKAMLGKYRSEYTKAAKFHIEAVGPFYPFIPQLYLKLT